MRTCKKCGGTYPEAGFKKVKIFRGTTEYTVYSSIDRLCEQTKRDTIKIGNRYLVKARNALYSHVDNFIKKGLIQSRQELIDVYGWDIHRMAHEIEHSYGNGCSSCGGNYLSMGHGLRDITLDITFPTQTDFLPYYGGGNTQWICNTCNITKKRMTPSEWSSYCVFKKLWNEQQEKLKDNPYAGMPLFRDYTQDDKHQDRFL